MEILNKVQEWIPGCWCAATIQLCERGFVVQDGARSNFPAQWAYFVWTPRDNTLPHAVPNGWGVLLRSPEADLAEIIVDAPVYFLKEFEADWPSLLDILIACEPSPPWLEERILQLREKAASRRREYWAALYDDDRPVFEAFMRRLLHDTAHNLKEM